MAGNGGSFAHACGVGHEGVKLPEAGATDIEMVVKQGQMLGMPVAQLGMQTARAAGDGIVRSRVNIDPADLRAAHKVEVAKEAVAALAMHVESGLPALFIKQ